MEIESIWGIAFLCGIFTMASMAKIYTKEKDMPPRLGDGLKVYLGEVPRLSLEIILLKRMLSFHLIL